MPFKKKNMGTWLKWTLARTGLRLGIYALSGFGLIWLGFTWVRFKFGFGIIYKYKFAWVEGALDHNVLFELHFQ